MRRILALSLLLLILTACTDQLDGIDLTASNNGETIVASQGQMINLNLDSNITTGLKWNLLAEPDVRVFKFISGKYNEPIGGGIGAGGSETWQFQTVGRGTTAFKLGYFRPFDPTQIANEFQVTITVQ